MSFTHLETVPGGERIAGNVTPADIARGPASLWRYAPLLPVRDPANVVTLGEGWTPLLRAGRLGAALGCDNLFIKDEGRNPSGTFKDRGASVAVSRYRELGVTHVALNSSGNAGASWALYAGAPIVRAYEEGRERVEPWGALDVPPGGLKSPNPPAGAAVLAILHEHGGFAIAVETAEALDAVGAIAEREGLFACPESATTIVGLRKALARGRVHREERVVVVCTGSGLKSISTLPAPPETRIASARNIA